MRFEAPLLIALDLIGTSAFGLNGALTALRAARLAIVGAFAFGRRLDRLAWSIEVLDAVGLSVFAVTGAAKALEFGLGPAQAVISAPSLRSAVERSVTP